MRNHVRVGSTHALIAIRLLLAFGLLFLSRVVFILFNTSYLDQASSVLTILKLFMAGIRYDLAALMMLNAAWIVLAALPFPFRNRKGYRWTIGWLYFLPNVAALFVNLVDVAFFRFTLRRTTGDVFAFLFQNEGMSLTLIPDFLTDYWYLVIIFTVLVWGFVRLALLFRVESKLTFHAKKAFVIWNIPLFLVWIALAIIGIRGGFQLKPVSLVNAATEVSARQIPAILNTPFVMVKTMKHQRLSSKKYMADAEALRLFNPDQQYNPDSLSRSFEGYNVVVIMMESFSLEHMAAGGQKGFTPFLDSLATKGLFFKAIANGKRSIEAIPAVLASLPTWMDYDFISSPYAANSINSLASLLKPLGYRSLFFHGGNNGTMSFNSFCNLAGFDEYHGRSEYNNDADFDGKWGIWDEPFFGYTARVLQTTPQPFVAAFFSLSSHHPYLIPDRYKGVFPSGELPIQQAVAYADYALGRFFRKAARSSWYTKTLFVITADHTSESVGAYYQTRAGQYEIPLLFYCPSGLPVIATDVTVQQTDIMPSVLDLLGFGKKFTAFGSSVFDQSSPRFAMNYADGGYQYRAGEYLIQFAGDRTTAVYNLAVDSLQQVNRVTMMSREVLEHEKRVKALIQQYNARMNANTLYIR